MSDLRPAAASWNIYQEYRKLRERDDFYQSTVFLELVRIYGRPTHEIKRIITQVERYVKSSNP